MSIADYELAKAMIEANKILEDFAGPRPEELIKKAEDALGVRYPLTYRRFLLDFGAGGFASAEFYGVIDEDWENSSVPDGVWYTLTERRQSGMQNELVVIGDTGMGELYVIDLSKESGPVFIVDPGTDMESREYAASDFGEYFLKEIQEEVVAAQQGKSRGRGERNGDGSSKR